MGGNLMRCSMLLLTTLCCFAGGWLYGQPSSTRLSPTPDEAVFERKLEAKIPDFDTAGRTFAASLLDVVYEAELPLGIEYLDRHALNRRIDVHLHDSSVRRLLLALVQQVPEYQVSFSGGLVDLYSPKGRGNSSNIFNTQIEHFSVAAEDTHRADMELLCELARMQTPPSGCGGSIAVGQWGTLRVTLDARKARVYEILNAIVAQNGRAIWLAMVPPNQLSKIPFGGLWHIYPLERPFKADILERLTSGSDAENSSRGGQAPGEPSLATRLDGSE